MTAWLRRQLTGWHPAATAAATTLLLAAPVAGFLYGDATRPEPTAAVELNQPTTTSPSSTTTEQRQPERTTTTIDTPEPTTTTAPPTTVPPTTTTICPTHTVDEDGNCVGAPDV